MPDIGLTPYGSNNAPPENCNRFIEEFFIESRPILWRMAFHMLDDRTLADDAVSEIWLRVLTHLPGFRKESKFTTWLYRIAMNTIIDMARAQKRTTPCPESSWKSKDPQDDPDNGCEQSLKDALVRHSLSQLPFSQRSLIIMRDIEDLSIRHIAEILEIPGGAVKSRLHRARNSLKRILQHKTRVPGKEGIGRFFISESGKLS